MPSRFARPSLRGFTLVEMAIVIIIIGLVAVFILPPLINTVRQGKINEAKTGLSSLRDQVIGYALDHNKLPASLADLDSPRDPFMRPWRYLANPAFCESNELSEEICDCSTNPSATGYVGSPVLRVLDQGGNTVDFVAFVVASDGPDHTLEIDLTAPNVNSTLPIAGWSKDVDLFNDTTGDGKPDPYDDLVQFVTLLELKALFNCAAASIPGGGGNDEDEPGAAAPWVETENEPTSEKIYGYGDDAEEGYEGIEYDGTKLTDGGDGGSPTLAMRVQANFVAEKKYNLEILAGDGTMGTVWDSGDYRLGENYLEDEQGVSLPFELRYNLDSTNEIQWKVAGKSISGVLPSGAANTVRVQGNFWILADIKDMQDSVSVTVEEINNFSLPDPSTLIASEVNGQHQNIYISQRTEAVDNLLIKGTVLMDWDHYPDKNRGLKITFEIHDVPLP